MVAVPGRLVSLRLGRRVLVGLVLLYVGTSLTLGGTRLARPVFRTLAATWVAGLGAYHVRRVLGQRDQPCGWERAGWLVDIIATNLVLTLVLAEGVLRVFCAMAGTSLVMSDTLDAHRLVAGQDYGGGLWGNRLGYPGHDFERDKQPGVLRIAALGDSFAVGPAVAFHDNYLTLLEKHLAGAEVYNFGVSGAGPREYLAILRRDVWTFQPDLVLVSVFVGNDVTETLPTPRYMDPRQFSLYLLLTRSWRLLREQWRQTEFGPIRQAERLPAPGLTPQTFREVEARRLAVCQSPPSAAMEKKWQRALADLDTLTTDCRRRGVPLAVVLIPDEFQVNPAVLDLAIAESRASRAGLDLQYPQRRLSAFFAARGVSCLDLLPSLAGAGRTYARRDTHWNERGNRLAAAAIATWLRDTVIRSSVSRPTPVP